MAWNGVSCKRYLAKALHHHRSCELSAECVNRRFLLPSRPPAKAAALLSAALRSAACSTSCDESPHSAKEQLPSSSDELPPSPEQQLVLLVLFFPFDGFLLRICLHLASSARPRSSFSSSQLPPAPDSLSSRFIHSLTSASWSSSSVTGGASFGGCSCSHSCGTGGNLCMSGVFSRHSEPEPDFFIPPFSSAAHRLYPWQERTSLSCHNHSQVSISRQSSLHFWSRFFSFGGHLWSVSS
mmetsp:Transcript_25211/g.63450  ORF Transcript_25211/g.63450 Transcript_25211/m.63450 type:complete len:239 (+) Transcript_25211:623-1339(+)